MKKMDGSTNIHRTGIESCKVAVFETSGCYLMNYKGVT